jgi:hypothetical protein
MSFEEKNTWAFGIIAIAGYVTYLALVLTDAATPVTETPFVVPMLSTIGGAIVAGILAGIVIGLLSGMNREKKDERDRQIYRRGEYLGHAFVLAGAIGALVLALADADTFWIANLLYLAFVVAAVVSSVVKLVAYRRGFEQW